MGFNLAFKGLKKGKKERKINKERKDREQEYIEVNNLINYKNHL